MIIRNIPASTLLISLALGYIVCILAKKEEKALKRLGYLIGTFIIVVSGVLILTKLTWGAILWSKIGCGMMPGKHMMMREQMPAMPKMHQMPQE